MTEPIPDIYNEIQDDLRQQKLNQFWKENGSWIIGGAIGAVVLTACLSGWREWRFSHDLAETNALTQVLTTADTIKLETFAKTTDKNHAMIARFAAADQYLVRHEPEKALALYNDIAKTSGLARDWRELAVLHSVSLRLDKDSPAVLEKELQPLAADRGTWRFSARELLALLAARDGRTQEAAALADKIAADPMAPEDIRRRAFSLRSLYAAEVKSNRKP